MAKWQELRTRLTQHTDFTPEQRDEITKQVLIVLEDPDAWPDSIADDLEKREDTARKQGGAVCMEEVREGVKDAIRTLEDTIL